MQDAVYDKLAHLALYSVARLFGLTGGRVGRDYYIAQITRFKIVAGRKREHVGSVRLASEAEIQFSYPWVAHERDGKRRVRATYRIKRPSCQITDAVAVDRYEPLFIDHFNRHSLL
jgi:hypothetical protein